MSIVIAFLLFAVLMLQLIILGALRADPAQTEKRVRLAILESHKSAIAASIRESMERMKRVPHHYDA